MADILEIFELAMGLASRRGRRIGIGDLVGQDAAPQDYCFTLPGRPTCRRAGGKA